MSKKKKCECPAGEKWAVPYADFLSLLLALFIALYALASVNMEKQKALKEEFIKIYKFPSANIVEEQDKQEKAMTDEPVDDNVEGKKVIVHTLENKDEQEQEIVQEDIQPGTIVKATRKSNSNKYEDYSWQGTYFGYCNGKHLGQ